MKHTKMFILLAFLSFFVQAQAAMPGDTLWAKSATSGSDTSVFLSVTTDNTGNIYTAGTIKGAGTYGFGNGVTVAGLYTYDNLALVKYNSNGEAQWAKSVTDGPNASGFNAVATDSSDNIYASGYINESVNYGFGNGVTVNGTNVSGYNLVLVKYDTNGTAQWAKSVSSGASTSEFKSTATDNSGNVYAVGRISGTGSYDFGNSVTISGVHSGDNIILVKYDSNGSAQWAQCVTSSGSNSSGFTSIAIDNSENIYAAGYIIGTGSYEFGNNVTISGAAHTGDNTLIVKYDSSGNAQWAKSTTSGSSNSMLYSVGTDNNGNSCAAGLIQGTSTYDFGNSITVNGTYNFENILVIKYNSGGNAQWAKSVSGGQYGSNFGSVTIDNSGNLYVAGIIQKSNTYDFGNGVTISGTYDSGWNPVLVKYDSNGNALWAKSVVSSTDGSSYKSVALDSDWNIYASGVIGDGNFGFGNGVITNGASSTDNVVLVKYSGPSSSSSSSSNDTNSSATTTKLDRKLLLIPIVGTVLMLI